MESTLLRALAFNWWFTTCIGGIILSIIAYLSVCNAISTEIIRTYDRHQYVENILHFHRKGFMRLEKGMPLYRRRCKVDEVTGGWCPVKATLKKGQYLQADGWTTTGYLTWVAARYEDKSGTVSGYLFIPEHSPSIGDVGPEDGLWASVDSSDIEKLPIVKSQKQKYLAELQKMVRIRKAVSPFEKERLRESGEPGLYYAEVPEKYTEGIRKEGVLLYVDKWQIDMIKRIYNSHLSDEVVHRLLVAAR
jgi:hypothetical protein